MSRVKPPAVVRPTPPSSGVATGERVGKKQPTATRDQQALDSTASNSADAQPGTTGSNNKNAKRTKANTKDSPSSTASAFVANDPTRKKAPDDQQPDAEIDPDQKAFRADPLSLAELQQPAAPSPITNFSSRLVALADGIDAGVVHGKRLTTLVAQFPAFSHGDVDRLWAPKTQAALAPVRAAYLDALEKLSQVAPDLEIPPMGQTALESARMNQLHAALHAGDDDAAVRIGRDAAALFPESPLVDWYAAPLTPVLETPAVATEQPLSSATNRLMATCSRLVDEVKSGALDLPAVQTAVNTLTFESDVDADAVAGALAPLAEVAPDVVIFGDQTLKEASLYGEILDAQRAGDDKKVAADVETFCELFPDSDRTAWLTSIVLDG